MLFNSISFLFYLPIVFLLYWFVFRKALRLQNLFLLLASYVFYGWWDWRFLGLIMISSLVDFIVGQQIEQTKAIVRKKYWLGWSLFVNLGILGFFKYFNFFVDSFADIFGLDASSFTLNIILPVGISFYTFQTLSYSVDVFMGRMKAEKDPVTFFAYVAFFPQLVAGPIERAKDLLPQFVEPRRFEFSFAADGLRQMLWGFFKKIVVADNCAIIVNDIFSNYQEVSCGALWLGAILFAFQIYGDFSGYSNIAIGAAKLFGIKLKQNFAFPYFSRDVGEFWRRWHISLSSWFRDYIYIPLGGSKGRKTKVVRNIFIIFLVSGFWHGANWTFILWGLFHALLFLPLILLNKNRNHLDTLSIHSFSDFKKLIPVLLTFGLVTIGWVLFRAPSSAVAADYLLGMFTGTLYAGIPYKLNIVVVGLLVLFLLEWVNRNKEHGLAIAGLPKAVRWLSYLTISFLIFRLGSIEQTTFIYFAF